MAVRFRLRPYPWTPAVRAALLAAVSSAVGLLAMYGDPAVLYLLLFVFGYFGWYEIQIRRVYFAELRGRAILVRRGNSGASLRYRDIDYVEVAGEDVIVANHSPQGYCEPREQLRLEDAQSFLLELESRRRSGRPA